MQIECCDTLSDTQTAEWLDFLDTAAHAHPRQHPCFAEVERALGRKVLFTIGREAEKIVAVGLWSQTPHPFFTSAHAESYCLSGPVCDSPEVLVNFLFQITQHPCFRKIGRIKVTPYWLDQEAAALQPHFRTAGWKVSEPEDSRQTGLVDLTRSEEDILAGFSKSARREFRRALRQDIIVKNITNLQEALVFFDSLNRLRTGRGLPEIGKQTFLTGFEKVYTVPSIGALIGAYHDGQFIGGLQLYRSHAFAHGRHFTTEPEILHGLGNLRISPILWHAGMCWAKREGCRALDLEGYQAAVDKSDPHYHIYKYKGEFGPQPTQRFVEHMITVNTAINLSGNYKSILKSIAKHVLGKQ